MEDKLGRLDNIKKLDDLELYNDILVVTTVIIPTRKILEVKGLVNGFAFDGKHRDEDFINAEKEARLELLINTKEMGANAVIGVTLNSTTYASNGQSVHYSLMYYTGTAVVIE